jgi:hypothetical protein
MIGLRDQERLFSMIGRELKNKTEAIVVGGSAMLFYNFSKTATKDIDIIMHSGEDRKRLVRTLQKAGFSIKSSPAKKGHPFVLVLDDLMLDIFDRNLFKLRISKGMLSRIRERIDFGNLAVSVLSPEDIILSKSMTERAGDREDAVDIIKEANLDWDAVTEECKWQSDNGDFRFCIYLYDFLDELVHEFGVELPKETVMKIKKLYRESLDNIVKKRK